MKKIAYIILLQIIITASCEKFEAEEPEIISFTVDKTIITLPEEAAFYVKVKADNAVIWPGDEGRNYEEYLKETDINDPDFINDTKNLTEDYNEGEAIKLEDAGDFKEDSVKITYTQAGTYTAVLIATNVGKLGDEVLIAQKELQITVE